MSVIDQLQIDLKAAMIARDTLKTDTLKGVKTAIQYAEVEARAKGEKLDEARIISILQKEAKKRAESAAMYDTAGATDRAEKERSEQKLIEAYLPAQLSDTEIAAIVTEVIAGMGAVTPQMMGQVIGAVKAKAGASADGAVIARLVKERIAA